MRGTAVMSQCGRYRYSLSRLLGDDKRDCPLLTPRDDVRPCVFIMLNPSTADAALDDPTIRRCVRYATDWGYDELIVVNLFAYRATSPADLMRAEKPVGPASYHYTSQAVKAATERDGIVVCAWGAHGGHLGRSDYMLEWLTERNAPAAYLRLTKGGEPGHPRYLHASLTPTYYDAGRSARG